MEFPVLKQGDITPDQVIGADIDIRLPAKRRLPRGRRSGKNRAGKLRREASDLLLPVIYQGSGADNQGAGGLFLLLVIQKKADHFQGLAKSHLIREDSAEAGTFQCFQPFVSKSLIGSQNPRNCLGNFKIRVIYRAEIAGQGPERAISGGGQRIVLLQQPVQIHRRHIFFELSRKLLFPVQEARSILLIKIQLMGNEFVLFVLEQPCHQFFPRIARFLPGLFFLGQQHPGLDIQQGGRHDQEI